MGITNGPVTKFPRKLKKGMDKLWYTRHMLFNRLRLLENALLKGSFIGPDVYVVKEKDKEWCRQNLKHPYPDTKWTRKAEAKFLKLRK